MTIITPIIAAERIERAIENRWLKQGTWHEGEHIACLLGSIDGRVNSPDAPCLASVAPPWLLKWTIDAFDGLAKDKINAAATLYVQTLRRGLSEDQWNKVSVEFRVWLIEDVLVSARLSGVVPSYWPAVDAACKGVIEALRGRGDLKKAAWASWTERAAEAAEAAEAAWASWTAGAAGVADAEAEAEAAWASWTARAARAAEAAARYRQFEALARIAAEIAGEAKP